MNHRIPRGDRNEACMKKFTLKKPEALDPEYGIPPELESVRIRIHSEPAPDWGTTFYEGSIRKFVLERLPSPVLTRMLPRLVEESFLTYRLSNETIHITRL